jgi:carboxylesterase type B
MAGDLSFFDPAFDADPDWTKRDPIIAAPSPHPVPNDEDCLVLNVWTPQLPASGR